MKFWKEHKDLLHTGEWHVHTSYTDGSGSVLEYCRRAEALAIPLIAFTEHVRRELTYDFNRFISDIEDARENFDLTILSGCEAKVLPGGDLDVESEILRQVDYPIFAFHSFPRDQNLFLQSLQRVLRNKYINAWAHPGHFLAKNHINLPEADLVEVLRIMRAQDVLLEVNSKYMLPPKRWIELAAEHGVNTVKGSDIHSIGELESHVSSRS
ncbi:MAG: PHP domain-containing protein [Methanothrix sp.]|jgi:DNA polymerase (family 10)/putative hydrolase|nr:PHP domain-containing protein [Methanothrix sp.]